MTLRIWKLHERANKYRSFIPNEVNFFNGKFQCKSLSADWDVPPAEIYGRNKPVADFVSWMSMAPVVSERARHLINELVGDDVEFLRFHTLSRRPYYVMNVMRCENYLDEIKSDLTEFHECFVFKTNLPCCLPGIFKCTGRWGEIFVTTEFAEMIVANNLSGAALADPGERTMPLVLENAEVNRYPGLNP